MSPIDVRIGYTLNGHVKAYYNATQMGDITLHYADDGTLTQADRHGQSEHYRYDGHHHRAVVLRQGQRIENVYDAKGRLLYQTNPSAGWSKRFMYVGRERVAQTTIANGQSKTTYYLNDLQGSPTAAFDAWGQRLWVERYRAFGARIEKPKRTENTQWFAGKPEDELSGLQYFNARYYSPITGRFLSIDPIGFKASQPFSFNRYIYANDNPYRYVDPTGLESWGGVGIDISNGLNVGISFGFAGQMNYTDSWAYYLGVGLGEGSWFIGEGEYLGGAKLAEMGAAKLAQRQTAGVGRVVARKGNTVIGKTEDLAQEKLAPGERSLLSRLPDKGSPKANWKQNSSVLRSEMKKNRSIRDASSHLPDNHPKVRNTFLGAERNLLRNNGWRMDSKMGYWTPPE